MILPFIGAEICDDGRGRLDDFDRLGKPTKYSAGARKIGQVDSSCPTLALMVSSARLLYRRFLLVIAVTMGCGAMLFCGVSPVRNRGETVHHRHDGSWTEAPIGMSPNGGSSKSASGESQENGGQATGEPDALALRGKVIEDPSGHALHAFYQTLAIVERSEEGGPIARVSCYGDSHTAADFMTGHLRRRMQGRFGDGGHGFIAAGRPWPSYRHRDIRNGARGVWETLRIRHRRSEDQDGRFGLAGVAVETDRPRAFVWIETSDSGPVGEAASSYELYYMAHPNGGRVSLSIDGEEVARLSTKAPRFRAAYHRVETDEGPHRFQVESRGHGMVRLFGIVSERDGPGVTVDSLGINGARVTAMLGWDETVFQENLAHRGPDLVVMWYGANSVGDDWYTMEEYEQWLIDAVTRVRRAVPEASCLLVGPPDMARATLAYDGPWGTPPELHRMIEAGRDVAGLLGCGYFDTFEAMGGEGSNLEWGEREPSWVSRDGIHFSALGYEAIADMLYNAIIDGYEQFIEAHPES